MPHKSCMDATVRHSTEVHASRYIYIYTHHDRSQSLQHRPGYCTAAQHVNPHFGLVLFPHLTSHSPPPPALGTARSVYVIFGQIPIYTGLPLLASADVSTDAGARLCGAPWSQQYGERPSDNRQPLLWRRSPVPSHVFRLTPLATELSTSSTFPRTMPVVACEASGRCFITSRSGWSRREVDRSTVELGRESWSGC